MPKNPQVIRTPSRRWTSWTTKSELTNSGKLFKVLTIATCFGIAVDLVLLEKYEGNEDADALDWIRGKVRKWLD